MILGFTPQTCRQTPVQWRRSLRIVLRDERNRSDGKIGDPIVEETKLEKRICSRVLRELSGDGECQASGSVDQLAWAKIPDSHEVAVLGEYLDREEWRLAGDVADGAGEAQAIDTGAQPPIGTVEKNVRRILSSDVNRPIEIGLDKLFSYEPGKDVSFRYGATLRRIRHSLPDLVRLEPRLTGSAPVVLPLKPSPRDTLPKPPGGLDSAASGGLRKWARPRVNPRLPSRAIT
jgi:hypothetical protein